MEGRKVKSCLPHIGTLSTMYRLYLPEAVGPRCVAAVYTALYVPTNKYSTVGILPVVDQKRELNYHTGVVKLGGCLLYVLCMYVRAVPRSPVVR